MAAPIPGGRRLGLGLVDAIGGEREAKAWLASAKGVPAGLPVEDLSDGGFASRALSGQLGMDGRGRLENADFTKR